MKKSHAILLVLVSALVFTILFYKQALGVNLLVYEFAILIYLTARKQLTFQGVQQPVLAAAVLLTAVFTVLHHSQLSFIVNFSVFFLFIGSLISPHVKSLLTTFKLSSLSFLKAPSQLQASFKESEVNNKKLGFRIKRIGIFTIPLLIVAGFILLYSWSNPDFNALMEDIGAFIQDKLAFLLDYIEIMALVTFLIGILISSFIFLRVRTQSVIDSEAGHSDELIRKKRVWHVPFKMNVLKNEYRAGVFLFLSLNLLLLLLNVTDIKNVWFSFEWEGNFLKQFVHEGTYLLLFAIFISIVLVLYYFRGNLNFYSQNKWLKVLCYVWLIQNVILTISVGIRNWHYIEHFALAYKRIAMLFFLALTIFGLFTVLVKVMKRRSNFYLFRSNAMAWVIVFVIASGFNWDRVIAQYNFSHREQSFVHLNFLSELSDSALPYLDKTKEELEGIEVEMEEKFSFFKGSLLRSRTRVYMTPEHYYGHIRMRKILFKHKWERKGLLEWNLAESQAYEALYGKE